MEEKVSYPIRINRYLALKKYCSRREADIFIKEGKVFLNRKRALLGDTVGEKDEVTIRIPKGGKLKKLEYYAYYKPVGIVTHSPQPGEKSIADSIKLPDGVVPLGRLDKESLGLIILTNDGRLTDKLLSPAYEHEKEYMVRVNKPITNIFLKVLRQGIQLEDFKTKPCEAVQKDDATLHITLTEGKRHQIRRMCAAFGYAVVSLKRIRIMNVRLKNLKANQLRKIEGKELANLLSDCQLK